MADLVTVTRRFVELFNQDFGAQPFDYSAELRSMFVAEPVVIPMRAALEGTAYSGPDALDQAANAFSESWTSLRIEVDELRALDEERVFVSTALVGVGRETGAETGMRLFWLIEFEGDLIAAARSFVNEREAPEAASR